MDTQHASDVPHALVSVLLQLAHRPIDHPHDYASRLIDRKRKLAEISLLGEDDFMSLRASTCSDSELDTDDSESESDESCAAPSEVSASGARSEHSPLQIPLQTAPESESECEIENVPHPLFLEELKRGNHSIVPEEFLVEDVVAMLLGLDADIPTISASILSLHDKTLAGFLQQFCITAQCLRELRNLSEVVRLVLPPIEDVVICDFVTDLWVHGKLRLSNLSICLPDSFRGGGSQPAFDPCWSGFRDELDHLLGDFDRSLSTSHRSLLFLHEAIKPRLRLFTKIHRLVDQTFGEKCSDSEEMRAVLLTKLSELIQWETALIPMWKKVATPLYDAIARAHAFNMETAGFADSSPFPIEMFPRNVAADEVVTSNSLPLTEDVLERIVNMPTKLGLATATDPLRSLSLNTSKKQAEVWLAAPGGPLRLAFASLHAVALLWVTAIVQPILDHIGQDFIPLALQKSIAKVLPEGDLGSVLSVPITDSLKYAAKHLSMTGSLSGNFQLKWNGERKFTLFDDHVCAQYGKVMKVLLLLHWTARVLPRNVESQRSVRGTILCAEMRHFLHSLRQYLALSIEEASHAFAWELDNIQCGKCKIDSIDAIDTAHKQFLRKLTSACLLGPEFEPVMDNICGVMTLIREFSAADTGRIDNLASDFRMRISFLMKAFKPLARQGLTSSSIASFSCTLNYNHFYLDE